MVVVGAGFAGLNVVRASARRRRRRHARRSAQPPHLPAAAVPGGDRRARCGRRRAPGPRRPADATARALPHGPGRGHRSRGQRLTLEAAARRPTPSAQRAAPARDAALRPPRPGAGGGLPRLRHPRRARARLRPEERGRGRRAARPTCCACLEDAARDPAALTEGALDVVVVGAGPDGRRDGRRLGRAVRARAPLGLPGARPRTRARSSCSRRRTTCWRPTPPATRDYAASVLRGRGVDLRTGAVMRRRPRPRAPGRRQRAALRDAGVGGRRARPPARGGPGRSARPGRARPRRRRPVASGAPPGVARGGRRRQRRHGAARPAAGGAGGQAAGRARRAQPPGALRRSPTRPFRYRDLGQMAIIGRSAGVAELRPASVACACEGLLGWLAWLFVHLVYLPGPPEPAAGADRLGLGVVHLRPPRSPDPRAGERALDRASASTGAGQGRRGGRARPAAPGPARRARQRRPTGEAVPSRHGPRRAFLAEALTVAHRAADAAARIHRGHAGGRSTSPPSRSPTDLVTEVDRLSEEAIRAEIAAAFPDHVVLGRGGRTRRPATPATAGSSTRSTAPSTTPTASPSTAVRSRSRSTARSSARRRARLRARRALRGDAAAAAPPSTASPSRQPHDRRSARRCSAPASPTAATRSAATSRSFARVLPKVARGAPPGRRGPRPVPRRVRALRRLLGAQLKPGTSPRRRSSSARPAARRPTCTARPYRWEDAGMIATNGHLHARLLAAARPGRRARLSPAPSDARSALAQRPPARPPQVRLGQPRPRLGGGPQPLCGVPLAGDAGQGAAAAIDPVPARRCQRGRRGEVGERVRALLGRRGRRAAASSGPAA